MSDPMLLDIESLTVCYDRSTRPSVNGLSIQLSRGRTDALIGRSGSGKSSVAKALLGLLPRSATVTGRMHWLGQTFDVAQRAPLRTLRGKQIALLTQEAQHALNPVRSVGSQLREVLRRHQPSTPQEALGHYLNQLSLDQATAQRYPHQLSGGQRQRVALALMLACQPQLLIADEVTSGLDQATATRLMDTLRELSATEGFGLLLITHDIGLVKRVVDTVWVLDQGQVAESGDGEQILRQGQHATTRALIASAQGLGE